MTVQTMLIPKRYWPHGELLNTNRVRGHTKYGHAPIKAWRKIGALMAREQLPLYLHHPVRCWVFVRCPDWRTHDVANYYPTAKALVDGVVDSGRMLGDDDRRLEGPWLRRWLPNGPWALAVVFVERVELGSPIDGVSGPWMR